MATPSNLESYPIDNGTGGDAFMDRLTKLVTEQAARDAPPEVYLLEDAQGRLIEPTPQVFGEEWGRLEIEAGTTGQVTHRGWFRMRPDGALECRIRPDDGREPADEPGEDAPEPMPY